MSSTDYQELPSFLEPTLIQPRVFDVDSDPSKPESSLAASLFSAAKTTPNADIGGWTFLQSLTKPKDTDVYVHPMEKRSTIVLSEQSLEMCTESLGSETGSDISEEMSMLLMEQTSSYQSKPRDKEVSTRDIRSNTFPPPLTSMSSSNGVEIMRSYSEDGRLVLEAVPTNSIYTHFQAERGNGRLRISLFKECDIDEAEEAEEEAETEAEAEAEAEEEDEEEYNEEDAEGNTENCGAEEISRMRSRCTEGGRGERSSIMNWEPFWVAT